MVQPRRSLSASRYYMQLAVLGLEEAAGDTGKFVISSLNRMRDLSHSESLKTTDLVAYDFFCEMADLVLHSNSQLFQDLWALYWHRRDKGGFFVEFGATDGKDLSNTYLLEKEFGWNGLLAEPNPYFHDQLHKNRACTISHKCVYSETGKSVDFRCTTDGAYSQVIDSGPVDFHQNYRSENIREVIPVETISLHDLLEEHSAPDQISYLSVDTEGSEWLILESFDFSARRIDVITVEHNYTANRWPIRDLLTGKGYVHLCPELSQFDDWYVHEDVMRERQGGG